MHGYKPITVWQLGLVHHCIGTQTLAMLAMLAFITLFVSFPVVGITTALGAKYS
jgi:hypothetical protein